MGKRLAHQHSAGSRIDSRESIRKKIPIFEVLGKIRANRFFSSIRLENPFDSRPVLAAIPFFGRSIRKKKGPFEARIDSPRIGPLRSPMRGLGLGLQDPPNLLNKDKEAIASLSVRQGVWVLWPFSLLFVAKLLFIRFPKVLERGHSALVTGFS